MWVAKRLDMPWTLWVHSLARTAIRPGAALAARQAEQVWLPADRALATLSVRSGWDLFLTAMRYPPGSEVLMSAITLREMSRIVEAHGLTPVPLDVDIATLGPSLAAARRLLTPRTRAVIIAHLFGGRLDLRPWGAFCQQHGLALVEDCAQAYDGQEFAGHECATASMFSFGPIKTATALGGALIHVRDAALLERMRGIHQTWPRQRVAEYRARLLKYAALKLCTSPAIYGLARHCTRGPQSAAPSALRNFPGVDLLSEIRRQPCAALLAAMTESLASFDPASLAARSAHAQRLQAYLGDTVEMPGLEARPHNHWVFPIRAVEPEQLISALAAHGFHVVRAGSMTCVPTPPSSDEPATPRAAALVDELAFLPCDVTMPAAELQRLAAVVRRHVAEHRSGAGRALTVLSGRPLVGVEQSAR